MRFKTLLLGSAAAFGFAGGAAQAADLSVAEPVDYVRVCDAFGAGYWYIPGTDTCIRIGGKVEFEAVFGEDVDNEHNNDPDLDDDVDDDDDSEWDFVTSFDVDVTTKTLTDWGPLVTYVNFTSDEDLAGDGRDVVADEYYLSIGPLLLGHTQSSFDVVGGGYSWSGLDLTDAKVEQVQLSWAFNGFGIVLGLEEGVDRWGTSSTDDMPDLVAALSAGGSGWDAKVAFIYADLVLDSLWAVEGGLELDVWGDSLLLGALYADNGSNPHSGSDFITEDGWAVLVSYQHNWSSTVYSAISFNYFDGDDVGDGWNAAFTTAFYPADNFQIGGEVLYNDPTDSFQFTLFAERTFGG